MLEIDKEVLPSKFEPIADSEIIKRQISVTQGGGELEDDEDVELSSKRPLSGEGFCFEWMSD